MWQCESVGSWWHRSSDIGNREWREESGAFKPRRLEPRSCVLDGVRYRRGNDFDLLFPHIVVSVCLPWVLEKELESSRWPSASEPGGPPRTPPCPPADSRRTALSPVWSGPPRAGLASLACQPRHPRQGYTGRDCPLRSDAISTTPLVQQQGTAQAIVARPAQSIMVVQQHVLNWLYSVLTSVCASLSP